MTKTPVMNNELIWRETDDGIVIVDPSHGKVRVLNGVASVIWKSLTDNKNTSEIVDHIVNIYQVSDRQAQADVDSFLSGLSNKGLIHWK